MRRAEAILAVLWLTLMVGLALAPAAKCGACSEVPCTNESTHCGHCECFVEEGERWGFCDWGAMR